MDNDTALLQAAQTAFQAGDYGTASTHFLTLLDRHPDNAALYINLGASRRAEGRLDEAERAYKAALALEPDNAQAWYNLGNVYSDRAQHQDALDAFRRADAAAPGTAEILNNIGVQHYALGDPRAAIASYDAAIAVHPDFADAWTNRGNAKQRLNDQRAAGDDIDQALLLAPDNAVFRLNKSAHLAAIGQWDDALAWADKAVDADPTYTEAQLKRASLLIQQQRLAEGFAAYEARWSVPDWHELPGRLSVPMWRGEDIDGKTILVWNEQGFGDALMYARFLPGLAARGATVIFACEPALMDLMRDSLPTVRIADLYGPLPTADVHISVMSLPHVLGLQDADDIRPAAPYLHCSTARSEQWAGIAADIGANTLKVGVVWAGNPSQSHDYARSIPFADIAVLLDTPNCRFFNLLIGERGNVDDDRLVDHRQRLTSFAETAALMSQMDVIISVDSAPAHLSGGLGLETWILLSYDPDSRYFLGTQDTPWYPSARLFRQSRPGDWAGAVAAVGDALNKESTDKSNR